MSRGRKLEEKQIKFALYAQVVREGGLKVPIIMRYSAIPGHCTCCSYALAVLFRARAVTTRVDARWRV